MFRSSNGTIELAMTHRVGAEGTVERCLRPTDIREIADRMSKWAFTPEICKSCSRLPAMRCANGEALCSRCHAQRAERRGVLAFGELRTSVARASEPEPDTKQLHGYAIRFNEKSVELWGFFETIRPAAADRMVAEQPDLRALWNHGSAEPLGRYSAGTLRYAKRSKGVWVEIDPPQWAARHVESIERRDVTGMSFGFIALEDDWWLEEGIPHREILDMVVVEVSPVSFPAYESTSIKAVRGDSRSSLLHERQTAERLRLAR